MLDTGRVVERAIPVGEELVKLCTIENIPFLHYQSQLHPRHVVAYSKWPAELQGDILVAGDGANMQAWC